MKISTARVSNASAPAAEAARDETGNVSVPEFQGILDVGSDSARDNGRKKIALDDSPKAMEGTSASDGAQTSAASPALWLEASLAALMLDTAGPRAAGKGSHRKAEEAAPVQGARAESRGAMPAPESASNTATDTDHFQLILPVNIHSGSAQRYGVRQRDDDAIMERARPVTVMSESIDIDAPLERLRDVTPIESAATIEPTRGVPSAPMLDIVDNKTFFAPAYGAIANQIASAVRSVIDEPTAQEHRTQTSAAIPAAIAGEARTFARAFTIELAPAHLGALRLTLHLSGDRMGLRIEVENQNALASVAQAKEELREILEMAGASAGDIAVGLAATKDRGSLAPLAAQPQSGEWRPEERLRDETRDERSRQDRERRQKDRERHAEVRGSDHFLDGRFRRL